MRETKKTLPHAYQVILRERMNLVSKMIIGNTKQTVERVTYGEVILLDPNVTPERKQDKSCGQRGLEPD